MKIISRREGRWVEVEFSNDRNKIMRRLVYQTGADISVYYRGKKEIVRLTLHA